MKKTVGILLAILCVFTISAGADTLVASFDFGAEALYNGLGPYADQSAQFTFVNDDSGSIGMANDITVELLNGSYFLAGINSNTADDSTDPIALFGDYYVQEGLGDGGDNQGNFKLTGLDINQMYDIYMIAPNGTGLGVNNVYGGDYTVGTKTVSATGGVDGIFTGWVEGRDFAVFHNVGAPTGEFSGTFNRIDSQDHTGIAGIQIVAVPEPATMSMVGFVGLLTLLIRRRFCA